MGLKSKTGSQEIGKEADIAIRKKPLLDIDNIRTVTAVLSNGNYYRSEPLWLASDFKPEFYYSFIENNLTVLPSSSSVIVATNCLTPNPFSRYTFDPTLQRSFLTSPGIMANP